MKALRGVKIGVRPRFALPVCTIAQKVIQHGLARKAAQADHFHVSPDEDLTMIEKGDIEQPRTPAELRIFVAETRARVEADPDELKKARRKVGLYKMFVDEVMPLALAADCLCNTDDLLRPVCGNQGYDVVVTNASGVSKGKIEIAKPYDGKANAKDIKLLEERGFGRVLVRDLGAGLVEVAAKVLEIAEKKSKIDYSDCILLFVAFTTPPFEVELEGLEIAAKLLCRELQAFRFIAQRVVLVVPPLAQCFVVQG